MIVIHKYEIYPVKDSAEWGRAYSFSKYMNVFLLYLESQKNFEKKTTNK